MDTCHHCDELKELLHKENIPFKTIDTNKHRKLFDIVASKTGFDHVPQLLINEWDGEKFINSRYVADFETLPEAVDQVKFLMSQSTSTEKTS
jgi:glutaredoxin